MLRIPTMKAVETLDGHHMVTDSRGAKVVYATEPVDATMSVFTRIIERTFKKIVKRIVEKIVKRIVEKIVERIFPFHTMIPLHCVCSVDIKIFHD